MTNDIKAKLTGERSTQLYEEIKDMDDLDRCQRVLKFF